MNKRLAAVFVLLFFVSWFCAPVMAASLDSNTVEKAMGDSIAQAPGNRL